MSADTTPLAPPVRAITLDEIRAARERIAGVAIRTPLIRLLHGTSAPEIWLKLENLQPINAFKIRGAANAVAMLTPEERARGVWTISAGNAGQGVAYAARQFGVPCTVVVIETAPDTKVERMRNLGAHLVKAPFDQCWRAMEARQFPGVEGTFVHPFDDHNFVAGNATLGLEIVEDLPNVRTVLTAIGGGGLISGMAIGAKSINPGIEIVGVQTERYPAAHHAFHRMKVDVPGGGTVAEGIAVKSPGALTMELINRYVDDIVLVNEEFIERAIFNLLEIEKTLVEGAGAAPLAAFLAGKLDALKGKRVVLVLCGGNIDLTILDRLIETGLVTDGRLARFTVAISDRPGGLARLTAVIASTGASIKEVVHDRAFSGPDLSAVRVVCVVETTGHEHVKQVHAALADAGISVVG